MGHAIRTTFTPFNIRRYGNSLDYSELERTSVYRLQCVHTSSVAYGSERNECSDARLALRALVICSVVPLSTSFSTCEYCLSVIV